MQTSLQGQVSPPQKGFWELFREFLLLPLDKTILKTVPEIGHLSPVLFTFGAAFVALLTFNQSLAVFSATTVEAGLLRSLFETLGAFTANPLDLTKSSGSGDACRSVFQTMTPARFQSLLGQGLRPSFPNVALYTLTFAVAYCLQSMTFFSNELSEMAPQFKNRPYLAALGGSLLILLYLIYLLAYGCDSLFALFTTVLLGGLVGFSLSYQNYLLFGKNSVNLMFLPILTRRKGQDFVCVTAKT